MKRRLLLLLAGALLTTVALAQNSADTSGTYVSNMVIPLVNSYGFIMPDSPGIEYTPGSMTLIKLDGTTANNQSEFRAPFLARVRYTLLNDTLKQWKEVRVLIEFRYNDIGKLEPVNWAPEAAEEAAVWTMLSHEGQ